MASASNGHQILSGCRHGVNAMPDNSTFDLDQGLADTALWREALQVYVSLEVPECNDLPVVASSASPTDLFQISDDEAFDSAVVVPMQLLNQAEQEAEQERVDLLEVYPEAKVEGNCITTTHHLLVVKRFLTDRKVSDVRHPAAYARLLLRLSRELRPVPTFESDNSTDKFVNPADYDGCLGQLLEDMEECIKTPEPWGPDGYVYVRRGTDTYVRCLLAAANELNSF